MNTRDLAGPVLKAVSRSFYLTIRILPARIQAPIGLAYLLARASDTIADTADAPAEIRLRHLAAFGKMIATGGQENLPELQREIHPPDPGERRLIAELPRCLEWLATLGEFDRAEIATVLAHIIRGQTLDLVRFPGSDRPASLETAAELDEYTYLVAGSVGEFWTRICLHHIPRYARIDPAELTTLARQYGQALQLINILRDLPADRRAGRTYLPADELRTDSEIDVFSRWHTRAADGLAAGRRYIEALHPARLRIGCYLPWHLGLETLRLLRERPPLDTAEKIKVPRSTVRAALLRAPFVALTNRALPA